MVIENTVPATPIVEAATVPSSVRAPVPPPLYNQAPSKSERGSKSALSSSIRPMAPRIPATTMTPGISQNVFVRKPQALCSHFLNISLALIGFYKYPA